MGHAGWLIEAGPLRLLFDPVLGDAHAGGVLAVWPRRSFDATSLRVDFVFVTHAHADHFDLDSLAALAAADPDTVLVTSDPLVQEIGSLFGFHRVELLTPGTRIDLADGVRVTLTPSAAPEIEWGVLVEDGTHAVWNLVDTVFAAPSDASRIAREILGDRTLDLAIAPLQPMCEVALATAGQLGLDETVYEHLLATARATGARVVVPGACGEVFLPPFEAMNRSVFPVSRERARRDLSTRWPSARLLLADLGDCVQLADDAQLEAGALQPQRFPSSDPRVFRPWDVGPIRDPNLDAVPETTLVTRLDAWIAGPLREALVARFSDEPTELRFALELVLPSGPRATTLTSRGRLVADLDPDYDGLVSIAASMLLDVVEGRRGWFEPLIGGMVRGVARPPIPSIFLYEAIGYRESIERATRSRARALAARLRHPP
jgi:UDP-MurNAc hydroxylase